MRRPILEYTDVVMNPHTKANINSVEIIQNWAVKFISNLKGRVDSVFSTREQLGLDSPEDRRKNHRFCFLKNILQNKMNTMPSLQHVMRSIWINIL